ncbi:MAG: hypothetical protein OHK0012_12900 [Synechococcales cyanobacterium]
MEPGLQGDAYVQALVERVSSAVQDGTIPTGSYGAILVDEGHDFQPEWLSLLTQQVDPQTNSLLLLYDDAQNLYGKKRQRKFSFKSVGIQAKGRTTILQVNYRNTRQILQVAYGFAQGVITPETPSADDDEPVLIHPESAGRDGPLPELLASADLNGEGKTLANRLQQLHNQGIPWQEMAVLYPAPFVGQALAEHLPTFGIPVEWLNREPRSRYFQPQHPSVKIMTLHASKGLEFRVVAIAGIGWMPYAARPLSGEARLLYVGMTRAIDWLLLSYCRPSHFVERLQTLLVHPG